MTQIKKEIRKILHSREIYDEVPVGIIATAVEKMVFEARIDELGRVGRLVKNKYPELLIIIKMMISDRKAAEVEKE